MHHGPAFSYFMASVIKVCEKNAETAKQKIRIHSDAFDGTSNFSPVKREQVRDKIVPQNPKAKVTTAT